MKSNHLLKSSLFIFVIFLVSCKQLARNSNIMQEKNCDIFVTDEGVFYKGKELLFDTDLSEWEKILGKSRTHIYKGSDAGFYVWDDLGFCASSMPQDDSQEWTKTKITNFYIYYRCLDSQLGRTGGLTDYGADGNYRNLKLEDLNEKEYGENGTKKEKEAYMKYQNSRSKKKSEFWIPYKIHKKPISLQGAIIDSTMSMEIINEERENKNLKLAKFRPVIGGVNREGRGNTTGYYPGEYGVETEFKDNKKFDITFDYNSGQVIYIKIRKLSSKEVKEYKRFLNMK